MPSWKIEHWKKSSYLLAMELTYPINFIGFDDGETGGDVLTRHGEYLGTWVLTKDAEEETGSFLFVADGESERRFAEGVSSLDSGLLTGLALSRICRTIRYWHEGKEPTSDTNSGIS